MWAAATMDTKLSSSTSMLLLLSKPVGTALVPELKHCVDITSRFGP